MMQSTGSLRKELFCWSTTKIDAEEKNELSGISSSTIMCLTVENPPVELHIHATIQTSVFRTCHL